MTAATARRSVSLATSGSISTRSDAREPIEQALRDYEGGGHDRWSVVDEIGFDVELPKPARLAGFEVVGSLAGPTRV